MNRPTRADPISNHPEPGRYAVPMPGRTRARTMGTGAPRATPSDPTEPRNLP